MLHLSHILSKTLILKAYELGIRDFDTSPLYSKGYSELLLGKVLKGKKDVLITTKVHPQALNCQTLLPLSLAIPLNFYLKRIHKVLRCFKQQKTPIPIELGCLNLTNALHKSDCSSSLSQSLFRLNGLTIDSALLHEVIDVHNTPGLRKNINDSFHLDGFASPTITLLIKYIID